MAVRWKLNRGNFVEHEFFNNFENKLALVSIFQMSNN